MSTSGQAVTHIPAQSPSRLQWAHLLIALGSFTVAVVALLTRPDMRDIVAGIRRGVIEIVTGSFTGLHVVSRHSEPSYDAVLAQILHGVQAVTILGFVTIHRTWLHDMASKLTDAMPIAKKTLHQFARGWMYMWYGWFTLYVWFFIAAGAHWHGLPEVDAVSDVLDVVSGFAIWWTFLVLDMPSVNLEGQPHRDRAFRRTVWIVAIAGVVCAVLGAADRLFDLNHIGVLVGLYNALALAFLTGRLGSHFMRMHRIILLCLYCYSMLQLFYSFLPLLKPNIWTPLVFLLAMILKIAVAYAGYDMLQNRGLERYLQAAQYGMP